MAREKRKLEDFGELWPAEALILAGLDDPHPTVIGNGQCPEPNAAQNRCVRASFLRWCALGSDQYLRLHETGLQIAGALVKSDGEAEPSLSTNATTGLDLEGCEITVDLGLVNCRFEHPPILRAAHLRTLLLNGSALPGLNADRLTTTGDISIRSAKTEGEVRLPSASVGGNLVCDHTTFRSEGGRALIADGLMIAGSVFLRAVTAVGETRLVSASIGANLVCDSGMFRNEGDTALNAHGIQVRGTFFWRDGVRAEGVLDLTAAHISNICDSPADWPDPGNLVLNRCEYDTFTGYGITGPERIDWLSRQTPARYGVEFWPQPWEHCARVFRSMEMEEDAIEILIHKERRYRPFLRKRMEIIFRPLYWLGERVLLDGVIRYGYRPLRAFLWLILLLIFTFSIFLFAWRNDAMKPNNAFVLRAEEWVTCSEADRPFKFLRNPAYHSQLDCFLAQPEGQSFLEFNALVYAADVLFPLVEIEQQASWTPDEDQALGLFAKWTMYLSIIFGWALSLLAVAGFSGLVKSD